MRTLKHTEDNQMKAKVEKGKLYLAHFIIQYESKHSSKLTTNMKCMLLFFKKSKQGNSLAVQW